MRSVDFKAWGQRLVRAGWAVALLPLCGMAGEDGLVEQSLEWSPRARHFDARADENTWTTVFTVTNRSAQRRVILAVQPSCGCTVPQLPADPWVLAPGQSDELKLTLDFTGKEGELTKQVAVVSDLGTQMLRLTVSIPPRIIESNPERSRNVAVAKLDALAVFKGDCARCHATPAEGKRDAPLYAAACGICHEAPHRASIVPNLMVPRAGRDAEYWRTHITRGKAGTLMPPFAQSEGGPLTPDQVESLVAYLLRVAPDKPAP